MDWTSWSAVLLVGLVAGVTGAVVYAQRAALLRATAAYRRGLKQRLPARLPALLRRRPAPAVVPPCRPRPN